MATTTTQNQKESRADNGSTAHSDTQPTAARGRGWHGNSEGHAEAGRKGGQTVSRNRDHMAEIGRKGGQAVSKNRDHMAAIGRKGGQSRSERSEDDTTAKDEPTARRRVA